MKSFVFAGLLAVFATAAAAHSPLNSTTPSNGDIIQDVPLEILFDFTSKTRLTRIQMTHADHPSVDLDLSALKGFASKLAVPLEGMGEGEYLIEWRGLGADGHALNGSFGFSVD